MKKKKKKKRNMPGCPFIELTNQNKLNVDVFLRARTYFRSFGPIKCRFLKKKPTTSVALIAKRMGPGGVWNNEWLSLNRIIGRVSPDWPPQFWHICFGMGWIAAVAGCDMNINIYYKKRKRFRKLHIFLWNS